MLLNTNLLFELPVYRLNESSYYQQFKKYKDKHSTQYTSDSMLIDHFGGQWEYNEIIGFLKFYISGNTQIRVEYHETDKKIKRRSRNRSKFFIKKTDSLCVRSISKTMTNEEWIITIEDCINHCKANLSSARYVDTKIFFSTFKYTNWVKVIA